MPVRILVINPGSTSTKVAIYEGSSCLVNTSYEHDPHTLALGIWDQYRERRKVVLETFAQVHIPLEEIDAVAARGGRIRPVASGVYMVNELLMKDSKSDVNGTHASSLAVFIGKDFASSASCPLYVVNPISVDEMIPEARFSGTPLIQRKSLGHALNSKEVARRASSALGKKYEDLNLVVAHLGGGTTISAHRKGKMIDLINDFEGGFTPERAGGLPTLDLVRLCFSGRFSEAEIMRVIEGEGGFKAYSGTKDIKLIEDRIKNGDEKSTLTMKAYLYQLGQTIGRMMAVLDFDVNGLCITGGMAKSQMICSAIKEKFSKVTKVMPYPGSFEMEALAGRVLNVVEGREKARSYPGGTLI